MGFSVGFGSKKSSSSGKSTTTFSVDETQEKGILQEALTKAQQNLTTAEQQTLNSLMQSMGLTNTLTSQTQQQQTQQQQNTTQQTSQQAQQQEVVKTSAFADQDIAQIRDILPSIFGQAQQNYATASGANLPQQIAAIQRQLTENTLPGVVAQEAGVGSYNSTSKQFLANDAIARGAELAANLQVEAARTGGQALSPIMQLAEILKGAEQTSQGNTTQNTTGSSTQQQNTVIQQLLEALTSQQQTTQQTQQNTSQQNTTGSQQSTSTEETDALTRENTSTEQDGTSTTKTKGKTKSSGFSAGFSS